MQVEAKLSPVITLNVPEWFQQDEFKEWLNDNSAKMTWHNIGKTPNEWSDTIVMVDPGLSGEGSNSDMPEQYWDSIVEACKSNFRN